MKYLPTKIKGCFIIEPAPRSDSRGFFARIFDSDLFREQGLSDHFQQFNNSLSQEAGTLRGLHYQVAPSGEDKLVRCTAGAVFDVVLDLRKDSPSFGVWVGGEITAENRRLMYAPKGCAHGFLTLTDKTELIYFASAPYVGNDERIIRWNDPHFRIEWPHDPVVLSDKDRDAEDYDPVRHTSGY